MIRKVKKIVFTAAALLTTAAVCDAQPTVGIAPYRGGRLAAVSYTFDDGLQDQYTLARPELNRRGLRATFAIIGSKVGGVMHSKQDRKDGTDGTPCMTWDMVRQLAADGHEIASHGWEHKAVTRLTPDQLRHEVQRNDSAILTETGRRPRTFVYPGNAKTDETIAFCEQDKVGSRTFQTSIGSKRDTTWLRQWVEGLVEQGAWGVGMTHGIARGYDHFENPQVLWAHLDYIAARQDEVWVAPLCEVAAYVKERENTELQVSTAADSLTVRPACTLDPLLFRQPLTLMLGSGLWQQARQDGQPLTVYRHRGQTLVDIDPHGGAATIY